MTPFTSDSTWPSPWAVRILMKMLLKLFCTCIFLSVKYYLAFRSLLCIIIVLSKLILGTSLTCLLKKLRSWLEELFIMRRSEMQPVVVLQAVHTLFRSPSISVCHLYLWALFELQSIISPSLLCGTKWMEEAVWWWCWRASLPLLSSHAQYSGARNGWSRRGIILSCSIWTRFEIFLIFTDPVEDFTDMLLNFVNVPWVDPRDDWWIQPS